MSLDLLHPSFLINPTEQSPRRYPYRNFGTTVLSYYVIGLELVLPLLSEAAVEKEENKDRFNGYTYDIGTDQLQIPVAFETRNGTQDILEVIAKQQEQSKASSETDGNTANETTAITVAVTTEKQTLPSRAPLNKADFPNTFKLENGKRVCEKKNDKPGFSKENNKGKKHMDMECCLDPDEIANPWCTYSPNYAKFLTPAHQTCLQSKPAKACKKVY